MYVSNRRAQDVVPREESVRSSGEEGPERLSAKLIKSAQRDSLGRGRPLETHSPRIVDLYLVVGRVGVWKKQSVWVYSSHFFSVKKPNEQNYFVLRLEFVGEEVELVFLRVKFFWELIFLLQEVIEGLVVEEQWTGLVS